MWFCASFSFHCFSFIKQPYVELLRILVPFSVRRELNTSQGWLSVLKPLGTNSKGRKSYLRGAHVFLSSRDIFGYTFAHQQGLPRWRGKVPACQCKRSLSMQEMRVQSLGWKNPRVGKIPRSRKWQSTSAFLPGKSHNRGAWRAIVQGVAKDSEMSDHTHHINDCSGITF